MDKAFQSFCSTQYISGYRMYQYAPTILQRTLQLRIYHLEDCNSTY